MTSAPPLLPDAAEAVRPAATRSRSGREQARRWRGLIVLVMGVVVLSIIAVAAGRAGSAHGTLDPQSYDPDGGRALATLLGERGVAVHRLTSVAAVLADAKGATTVVVADPVDEPDLKPLRSLPAQTRIMLVAPDQASMDDIQPGLDIGGDLPTRTEQLDCSQPDAVVAGAVQTGGESFLEAKYNLSTSGVSCYVGTLYQQPFPTGGGYIDVGSADMFSNAELGDEGNAALGIGLLDHDKTVLWLVPGPTTLATTGTKSLTDLLPARLGWAVLQGIVAVALLMLWRARRLGRVVAEPLPVVIRASETVEGLGRLYRAASARRRAAGALRAAALARMAPRLGVHRDDGTAAMVDAVASRTGRNPTDVTALLYGAEPEDDQALVTLADELDALEAEVRRS